MPPSTGNSIPFTWLEPSEARNKPIPRSTSSLHMRVLRKAGLIRGERHGVEMRNTSRYAEVDARYPGLLLAIVTAHTVQIEGEKKG